LRYRFKIEYKHFTGGKSSEINQRLLSDNIYLLVFCYFLLDFKSVSSALASPGGPATVSLTLDRAARLREVEDLSRQVDLARAQAIKE